MGAVAGTRRSGLWRRARLLFSPCRLSSIIRLTSISPVAWSWPQSAELRLRVHCAPPALTRLAAVTLLSPARAPATSRGLWRRPRATAAPAVAHAAVHEHVRFCTVRVAARFDDLAPAISGCFGSSSRLLTQEPSKGTFFNARRARTACRGALHSALGGGSWGGGPGDGGRSGGSVPYTT